MITTAPTPLIAIARFHLLPCQVGVRFVPAAEIS
jgi:hypothetical protein